MNQDAKEVVRRKSRWLLGTVAGLLATGLGAGAASPIFAQDELTTLAENFFPMPELFESLSFSPGEILTVSSPDPAAYMDFVVPTVEGRLRLGIQSTFLSRNQLRQADAGQAMVRVGERLTQSAYLYLALLAVQHMGDMISAENLLSVDNTTGQAKYVTFGMFVPRGFMALLAANLLQDAGFHGYFCNGDAACEAQYRQVYRFGPSMESSRVRSWGRGADEFVARSAVEAFLQKDAATLVEWSGSLSPEVALVGMIGVPEYDFDAGGFALQLKPPLNAGSSVSDFHYQHFARPDAPLNLAIEAQVLSAFLALDGPAAQALSVDLAERRPNDNRGMIYYVLEGTMLDIGHNLPKTQARPHGFLYEISSPTVRLYKDARLQELIAELPLTTN